MSKIKVNYIGDSHSVLTFGQTIIEQISSDVDLHLVGFSGLKLKNTSHWLNQKNELKVLNCEFRFRGAVDFSKVPEEIGTTFDINDADVLVIALGTNDIVKCATAKQSYKKDFESAIHTELETISVEKRIFIEPPILSVDGDKKIRNQLLDQVKQFGFSIIPCASFTADQSDGIHMRKEMAQSFGNSVAKELLKLILPHH